MGNAAARAARQWRAVGTSTSLINDLARDVTICCPAIAYGCQACFLQLLSWVNGGTANLAEP
jgi:hypothetical protein